MPQLKSVVQSLNELLDIDRYKDASLNGLQVEASQSNIRKVAVAVDAGESVIEQAISKKSDLLIVHHGLFWGQNTGITGPLGRKVAALLNNNCSLYTAHLPLDAHLEVGNNAIIARKLGLKDVVGFCKYAGADIGVSGIATQPLSCLDIVRILKDEPGMLAEPLVLGFGEKSFAKIGIVSGSGSSAIEECAAQGLECLISGESKQEAYHLAKEYGINCVFLGHYGTETFGVQALGKYLEKNFSVESVFINEPTGI